LTCHYFLLLVVFALTVFLWSWTWIYCTFGSLCANEQFHFHQSRW